MIEYYLKSTTIVAITLILLASCGPKQLRSIGSIPDNPTWHLESHCGYEGCGAIVDFLINNDLKIRVEPYNRQKSDIFLVQISFERVTGEAFEFQPDRVTITLGDKTFSPKPFRCAYTIGSRDYLEAHPGLSGRIRLTNERCFLLYYDMPTPSIEETFLIKIEGLFKNGTPVEIPEITFENPKVYRGQSQNNPRPGDRPKSRH
jgi:hypothetical protein